MHQYHCTQKKDVEERNAKEEADVTAQCTHQWSFICWYRQPSLENLTTGLWTGSGHYNTASQWNIHFWGIHKPLAMLCGMGTTQTWHLQKSNHTYLSSRIRNTKDSIGVLTKAEQFNIITGN